MISRRLLRIKVLKELYGYIVGKKNSLPIAEKELIFSINKTYEQYQYLFCFLPLLQEHAQSKIETGLHKFLPTDEEKNPNTRFIKNKVLKQIANNKELTNFAAKNSLILSEAKHLISKMYNNIAEKDYFSAYMSLSKATFHQDKKLVMNILNNEFEDFHDLYSMLEEQSIYWTDEPEFIVSIIIKTVKGIEKDKPFSLFPLYKNEDDEQFAERLFRHSILNYDKYNELIDKHTPNWDVERIALMDTLILVIAISEVLEFPGIPIKVTLDEYIDLARYYSTLNSSIFVNGVLDKIIEHFKQNRLLNKIKDSPQNIM
ncbi:MAG: transcription antitermination protein NusB [Prevotellaceae bacterium]|jgi:N utilization substance protein B|nr:transcription antitermination protein NusB [Prevotellaceae bacterium]